MVSLALPSIPTPACPAYYPLMKTSTFLLDTLAQLAVLMLQFGGWVMIICVNSERKDDITPSLQSKQMALLKASYCYQDKPQSSLSLQGPTGFGPSSLAAPTSPVGSLVLFTQSCRPPCSPCF